MAFRIGQKVVCVDDGAREPRRWWPGCAVKRGEIYTIRGFVTAPYDGIPCILVEELRNIIAHKGIIDDDAGYRIERFRPLVEKKTDISTLTALLNPLNHKKLEDA